MMIETWPKKPVRRTQSENNQQRSTSPRPAPLSNSESRPRGDRNMAQKSVRRTHSENTQQRYTSSRPVPLSVSEHVPRSVKTPARSTPPPRSSPSSLPRSELGAQGDRITTSKPDRHPTQIQSNRVQPNSRRPESISVSEHRTPDQNSAHRRRLVKNSTDGPSPRNMPSPLSMSEHIPRKNLDINSQVSNSRSRPEEQPRIPQAVVTHPQKHDPNRSRRARSRDHRPTRQRPAQEQRPLQRPEQTQAVTPSRRVVVDPATLEKSSSKHSRSGRATAYATSPDDRTASTATPSEYSSGGSNHSFTSSDHSQQQQQRMQQRHRMQQQQHRMQQQQQQPTKNVRRSPSMDRGGLTKSPGEEPPQTRKGRQFPTSTIQTEPGRNRGIKERRANTPESSQKHSVKDKTRSRSLDRLGVMRNGGQEGIPVRKAKRRAKKEAQNKEKKGSANGKNWFKR
mmetsp:Transcript_4625/g.10977  ORF Transcript_4625/g.10977 Transcript_4625/m.10977 type:complete len:452 (+) Transcript_4625:171-1526(+)